MAYSAGITLGSLPPEIRSKIYSFVFNTEQGGLISLRVEKNGDWANDSEIPPVPYLRLDPRYTAYRRKVALKKVASVWPDYMEDVFFQGMFHIYHVV